MRKAIIFQSLIVIAGAGLAGCTTAPPDTVDGIKASLELSFGGYRLDDEMPMFARKELDPWPVVTSGLRVPQVPDLGISVPPPHQVRERGFIVGQWGDLDGGPDQGYGLLLGKWVSKAGETRGHLKGIYGKSQRFDGWVFFGKVIDLHGYAFGLLSGYFRDGMFNGTWADESGRILGVVRGAAKPSVVAGRTLAEGAGKSGGFIGGWEDHRPPQAVDNHWRRILAASQ